MTIRRYFWCLKCHKVYLFETWCNNHEHCPSNDCKGESKDMFAWGRVRDVVFRNFGVDYPRKPVKGHSYELDGL
jgi:hypothetical protein